MGSEEKVTKDNFKQEVLDAGIPVLVDLWAPWCMPCKMVEPILDKLAEDLNGKIKVVRVNVDEEPELAAEYNIVSIPTLLVFKGGELVDKKVGAVPRPVIDEMIKQYL
jgi:thioredoxin 1